MPRKSAEELIVVSQRFGRSLIQRLNSFSPAKVFLAAVLAFAVLGVMYHYLIVKWGTPSEVTFLSAPSGAKGFQLAERLSHSIAQPAMWDFSEPRLRLVPQPTDGYEDNRRRIQDDRTGLKIGFAHDGFEATDNVQVLLPLDYTFLHVVISKEMYAKATEHKPAAAANILDMTVGDSLRLHVTRPGAAAQGSASGPSSARMFKDVVPMLKSGDPQYALRKVFLGVELSGTRQLTNIVMSHYGIPTTRLDFGKKYDWTETVTALLKGEIHMAFFLTEPGLSLFHELAKTGDFHLLGFDDVEGITATHPYIYSVSMPRHTYGYPVNNGPEASFCPSDTWTMATRRVIVAPSSMEKRKAFFLAHQLTNAFEATAKPISWKLPPTSSDQATGNLYYLVHPGAKYLEQNRTPWYHVIAQSVQTWGMTVMAVLVGGFLVAGVIAVFNYLTRIVALPPSDASPRGGDEPPGEPTPPPGEQQLATAAPAPSLAAAPVFSLGAPEARAQTHRPLALAYGPAAGAELPDQPGGGGAARRWPQTETDKVLLGLLDDVEQQLGKATPERFSHWQRVYRSLARRCVDEARKHQLSEEQQEELRAALAKLDWEIESCRPQPDASGADRRTRARGSHGTRGSDGKQG